MAKGGYYRWAILWPVEDGPDMLMGDLHTGMTKFYRTRQEARQDENMRRFNQTLRRRKDLREAPHNWKAKRPVKVLVTVETI